MAQFGCTLSELYVNILCANSRRAKGRDERANRTLQDRLAKELHLSGISDIKAANALHTGFITRHHLRFAHAAARPENLHQTIDLPASRLSDIHCILEARKPNACLIVHSERQNFILDNSATERYVKTYDRPTISSKTSLSAMCLFISGCSKPLRLRRSGRWARSGHPSL